MKRSIVNVMTLAALVSAGLALSACDRGAPAGMGSTSGDASVAQNRAPRSTDTPPNVAPGGGSAATDSAVTAAVNSALSNDGSLSGAAIMVDTLDGKVTLRGSVTNAAQRDKATEVAKAVPGVHSVDNKMNLPGQG